jgi:hypothetical protein
MVCACVIGQSCAGPCTVGSYSVVLPQCAADNDGAMRHADAVRGPLSSRKAPQ